MTSLKNKDSVSNLFLRALSKEQTPRPPVWIMRQAGRYMPEYKALRASVNTFTDFYKNPELCMKAALLPIDQFALDASIVFSDILIVPEAMGMELKFVVGEGPVFPNPIRTKEDLKRLKKVDAQTDLKFILDAIQLTIANLPKDTPLIGFAGSPWTLAAYMVEGQSSKTFSVLRGMMYSSPELLHGILSHIADSVIDLLICQINAGAKVVQIFDSWAGLLSDDKYKIFSLPYIKMIVDAVKSKYPLIPIIVFAKNNGRLVEELSDMNINGISLDWQSDITKIKSLIGNKVAIQGNLDPCALYGSESVIRTEVTKILDLFAGSPGFIFNLGHGIYPDIPVSSVKIMLDTIRNYNK